MASGSNVDDADPSSLSLMVETTNPKKMQQFTGTLTSSPPLPTLTFDLIAEILCRLPVKLLLQLRCLCKSFNSLISDPKFAKKHLRLSTTHHHLMVTSKKNNSSEFLLLDSPISSVFSTSRVRQTQHIHPIHPENGYNPPLGPWFLDVCSCDGILLFTVRDRLLFTVGHRLPLLWNPSIRKFNKLPPLDKNHKLRDLFPSYSFGYDHFIDNYKVIVIFLAENEGKRINEVRVYTLGTDYWRRIKDLPSSNRFRGPGMFLSGTVNWLAYDDSNGYKLRVIVSLDLEKELYEKLPLPDLEDSYQKLSTLYSEKDYWTLGVFRDCLCLSACSFDLIMDFWIMKEYRNKESWTKLCNVNVSYVEDWGLLLLPYGKALYIAEDDQVLMYFHESTKLKLVVYDSINGTFKIPDIQNINTWMDPVVYIESLISPCSRH